MKNIICIVCPKGCHLSVDENNDFAITGNSCERGAIYGRKELTAPTRVLTSTVKIRGSIYSRCPVKTDDAISKELIKEAMELLNHVEVESPVRTGDIVVKDICGTPISFVATKNM
jgi:CxxC motif-containing protein